MIDDESLQNADTVVAIFKKSLEEYKQQNPDVTEAFLRSDNAACYKSQRTIQGLWSLQDAVEGLHISGYHFSEAQGGKSR